MEIFGVLIALLIIAALAPGAEERAEKVRK
jgi:hypothetical protein